jgi:hypothetical protein
LSKITLAFVKNGQKSATKTVLVAKCANFLKLICFLFCIERMKSKLVGKRFVGLHATEQLYMIFLKHKLISIQK